MFCKLLLTVNEGFEEESIKELHSLGIHAKEVGKGRLEVVGRDLEESLHMSSKIITNARSVNRVYLNLSESKADLQSIERTVKSFDTDILPRVEFKITSKRFGVHTFSSSDVGRIVFNILKERGIKLSKNSPFKIRADVKEETFRLLLDLTGEGMHKRGYRVCNHPAPLKTTVAASLLFFSQWRGPSLHDVMCGGGTIISEALLLSKGIPPSFKRKKEYSLFFLFPWVEREVEKLESFPTTLYASDINIRFVECTKENLSSLPGGDGVKVFQGDATKIPVESNFVITNPPYGKRLGSRKYKSLYYKFARHMKEERVENVVVLTYLYSLAKEAFLSSGYELKNEKIVMNGNLRSAALHFVL